MLCRLATGMRKRSVQKRTPDISYDIGRCHRRKPTTQKPWVFRRKSDGSGVWDVSCKTAWRNASGRFAPNAEARGISCGFSRELRIRKTVKTESGVMKNGNNGKNHDRAAGTAFLSNRLHVSGRSAPAPCSSMDSTRHGSINPGQFTIWEGNDPAEYLVNDGLGKSRRNV